MRPAPLVLILALPALPLAADDAPPVPEQFRTSPKPVMDLEAGFATPPLDARTRVWWWWLNGNVNRAAITRDLEAMKAQGIGGYNLIDASGATQDGHRNVPPGPVFASPEWNALFRFALDETARLGLEGGLNIQSGWNLGGPCVTPDEAAKRLTWSETVVSGPADVDLALPQPAARGGYYRDARVVAYPLREGAAPPPARIEAQGQGDHPIEQSFDGDTETFWVSPGGQPGMGPTKAKPEIITLQLPEEAAVDAIRIVERAGYGPTRVRIEASDDGTAWRTLAEADTPGPKPADVRFPRTTAARFRIVIPGSRDPRFPDRPRNVQIAELSLMDGARAVRVGTRSAAASVTDVQKKAYYTYPGQFSAVDASFLQKLEDDQPGTEACRPAEVVDLTACLDSAGRLRWKAPAGRWCVLRFGGTLSGAEVSTSSDTWKGPALDYLDRTALESYWRKVVDPLIAAAGPHAGKALRFFHTDSWELGPVNWSRDLPADFRRRRGYDMTPWIPVLAGRIVSGRDASNRFLNDFRRTLAECIADNHYAVFAAMARRHGIGIHPESGGPHAAPVDALLCLGRSDIPMGEFWARNDRHRVADNLRLYVKQSSSAAHIYGLRINQAEGFTTIGPHWERAPRDLKNELDRVYCEGLNRVVWHTFTCSPPEMGLPGQEYFAGTHFNPQVTWFPMASGFVGYMNRCQFLLQQGLPVSDVLHYYGDNVPTFVRLKREDPAGALPGFDYDACNLEALLQRVRANNGRLVMPDGAAYRVLSLHASDSMALPALRKVAELARAGATVVGSKPRRATGLDGWPACDAEFRKLADELWGAAPDAAGQTKVGAGRVVWGRTARETLLNDGVGPDFDFRSVQEKAFLDYVHRRTDAADLYFVINRLSTHGIFDDTYRYTTSLPDRYEEAECSFRVTGRVPELWDPITGTITEAAVWWTKEGRTFVPLRLAPEGSVFVIFRKPSAGNTVIGIRRDNQRVWPPKDGAQAGAWPVCTLERRGGRTELVAFEPGAYEIRTADGVLEKRTAAPANAITPAGPWEVRFIDGRGAPEKTEFAALTDWSQSGVDGIRYYSGRAVYRAAFEAPAPKAGARAWIDLGNVLEIASVRLNGKDLGIAWIAPFRVEATGALLAGRNELEITVANLWPNRLTGDAKLPPEKKVTKTNIVKYDKGDRPLRPSGLLGPVTVRFADVSAVE